MAFVVSFEHFMTFRRTVRSDNCSATFLKILRLGHFTSGHLVRSSDLTSEKLLNRVTATVVER